MGTHGPQPTTFVDHVRELRRRLMYCAGVFLIGSIVGYVNHARIVGLLRRPLDGPLFFDTPAGNFNLIMEVSILTGLVLALPLLLFHVIRFIEPATQKHIKKRSLSILVLLSGILAFAGSLFAYYVVLPMSLHFFLGFKISGVSPLLSAASYLDFVIKCIMTFVIIFQLPLIILFIHFIRPIPPATLLKYEKHVIVGSLLLAVVLPFTYDPITQFAIAVPIVVLYNVSLLLVALTPKRQAPAVAGSAIVVTPDMPESVISEQFTAIPDTTAMPPTQPATIQKTTRYTTPGVISDMVGRNVPATPITTTNRRPKSVVSTSSTHHLIVDIARPVTH